MDNQELKVEFEKHIRSRECEKPSREMLFEFFREGFKAGGGKLTEKSSAPIETKTLPKDHFVKK